MDKYKSIYCVIELELLPILLMKMIIQILNGYYDWVSGHHFEQNLCLVQIHSSWIGTKKMLLQVFDLGIS